MSALEQLFNPQCIAVVGASPKPGSFGGAVLRNLATHYRGTVYAVNPSYQEVAGVPCFRRLAELPQVPDCVGIAVAADLVEAVLRDAAAMGCRYAVVFSSGFADTADDAGRRRQASLQALARELKIRVLGPNCTGFVNVASGAACNILPSIVDLPMHPGGVSVAGQSGALGYVVLQAMHRGVGFSQLISVGNSADIDLAEVIDHLVDDAQTRCIALLFESVPDARKLSLALRRAFEQGKPVVAYKIGTTDAGRQAALSHSGMLAGSAQAYRAMFLRNGVVEVNSFESLLETAIFFSVFGQVAPTRSGIGIISGSGGSVVMAADKSAEYGLQLPPLHGDTRSALAQRLPSFAAIANPADITAESIRDQRMYQECVEIFARDPAFASIVVLMPSAHGAAAVDRARAIAELSASLPVPMSLVWINEWHQGIGSEIYDACPTMATFRSLDRCMAAHQAWFAYARRRAQWRQQVPEPVPAVAVAPTPAPRPSAQLSEAEAKRLLAGIGVQTCEGAIVSGADDAVQAADAMGYPVVVKAESAFIAHKSDIGAVKLDLADADAVRTASTQVLQACRQHHPELQDVQLSVQRMVPTGIEMIIGARVDPDFGPLVVYGFGGVLVELLRNVAVGLAPVPRQEVLDQLAQLPMAPLLQGYRGFDPADVGRFADQVVRISHLIHQNPWMAEIDINPVILSKDSAIAVDALITMEKG